MYSPIRPFALPLLLLFVLAVSQVLAAQASAPKSASSNPKSAGIWCGESATYDALTTNFRKPFGKIDGGAAQVELDPVLDREVRSTRWPRGPLDDKSCSPYISVARVQVSTAGEVGYFPLQFGGITGGPSVFLQLDAADLRRLDLLMDELPDDHRCVPPPSRRTFVSVVRNGAVTVRLYDRERLPNEVIDMMRLTGSRITVPAQNHGSVGDVCGS